MLGPKTENSVHDGNHNLLVGHNAGTIQNGLTFAEHQAAVEKLLSDRSALLERAHGAERALLQSEVDGLRLRLANIHSDYEKALVENEALKAQLAKYDNQIGHQKREAATAAMDRGDRTLARALMQELADAARNRHEDAAREVADLEFTLGQIAETDIRWHDAARHFALAAGLNSGFNTLRKAREYAWRAGDYRAAHHFGSDLLVWARAQGTQEQLASALNEHAITVQAQGLYAAAEGLFRQALAIDATSIGKEHPAYATHLNNHAAVVEDQGRYAEAEGLYRQALAIDEATIGGADPVYATHLNNLAGVVRAQGRYAEAEGLYRQALAIDEARIGKAHPDYAIDLNNLAGVVQAQGRLAEAEELYRQALAIGAATIGKDHPAFAMRLNNLAGVVRAQGRYAEARGLYQSSVAIYRARLGDGHPDTQTGVVNYLDLLLNHFPDDPEIPALLALLPANP